MTKTWLEINREGISVWTLAVFCALAVIGLTTVVRWILGAIP